MTSATDLAGDDLDEREVVARAVQRGELAEHALRLVVRLVGLLARAGLLAAPRPGPQLQDQSNEETISTPGSTCGSKTFIYRAYLNLNSKDKRD